MKNLKKINRQYLLNLLFKSQAFKGCYINKLNTQNINFLKGKRFNETVINLEYSINSLKRSFNLISLFLEKKKKILIIGDVENKIVKIFEKYFLNDSNIIKNNIYFYTRHWVKGSFSNRLINENYDLIILLPTSVSNYILVEAKIRKIPVISFSDGSENMNTVLYPLYINTKHAKTLFILLYLFRKIFLKQTYEQKIS